MMRIFVPAASYLLTDHLAHGEGLFCCDVLSRLARRGHEIHACSPHFALHHVPEGLILHQVSNAAPFPVLAEIAYQHRVRRVLEEASREAPFDLAWHIKPFYIETHFSLIDGLPLVVGPMSLPSGFGIPLGLLRQRPGVAGRGPTQGWRSHPIWTQARLTPPGRFAYESVRSFLRALYFRTLRRADGILVFLPSVRGHLPRWARAKTHVTPFGVDTTRFTPGLGGGEWPTILFLANLARNKGLEDLLQAMPEVLRQHPRVELRIAGDGPDRGYFEGLARQLGLDGHVAFLGFTPPEPKLREYQRADVYCLLTLGEPYGFSLLEAMSCGLPIVATGVGSFPQLLEDGASGYLVPPVDSAAVARALNRLLASPADRQRMGTFNRARSQRLFDAERCTDAIEQVLLDVAQSRA